MACTPSSVFTLARTVFRRHGKPSEAVFERLKHSDLIDSVNLPEKAFMI